MKKRILFASVMMLFGFAQLFAFSDVYYIRKTIIQSVQACGPVTVDAAKIDSWGNIGEYSKYTVSSGTTWSQRMKIKGGYDCNGTNLRILLDKKTERKHHPNGVKYGNTVYHYVEYETYYYTISTGSGSYSGAPSNSSNRAENSTPSSSGSYSSGGSGESRGAQLGSAWAGAAQATKIYDYRDNYRAGGFSLAATISPLWGENLELRFRYGSSRFGGDITGMIGYDWINNKKIAGVKYKPNWSAGIGMYFGGRPSYIYLWDVDLGVKFGKSSKPVNNSWTAIIDLSTTHLIGPEHVIGLIAGAGVGLAGNGKNPGFAWDVRGGIVIYFLQWNWL